MKRILAASGLLVLALTGCAAPKEPVMTTRTVAITAITDNTHETYFELDTTRAELTQDLRDGEAVYEPELKLWVRAVGTGRPGGSFYKAVATISWPDGSQTVCQDRESEKRGDTIYSDLSMELTCDKFSDQAGAALVVTGTSKP